MLACCEEVTIAGQWSPDPNMPEKAWFSVCFCSKQRSGPAAPDIFLLFDSHFCPADSTGSSALTCFTVAGGDGDTVLDALVSRPTRSATRSYA